MGLDMYLRLEETINSVNWNKEGDPSRNEIFDKLVNAIDANNLIDTNEFTSIHVQLPVGYWRKANQIHNWFVKWVGGGEDNCQAMYLGRSALDALRTSCTAVLADHSKAEELLPTGTGFFFGSTDYDEWYYEQLEHTIKIIDRCLASNKKYFEYQASW